MKRKIYDVLLEWKKDGAGKTALLIDGARRVGKSYIVEEFAKAEYKTYLMIDFNRVNDEVKDLFNNYLNDLDSLFMYLSVYYNVKLYPHESLIIFDEVQMYPRARAAIKYLVADGRYDYIETGSLMSIKKNVQDILIPSEERHIRMYPMDFEEFLLALGNDTLMGIIKKCFTENKPMGQSMHASGYEIKVASIFDEIPSQLQKHEKKFKLSSISKEARLRDYEDALFWLEDAMIVNICYNSTAPSIGLKLNMDRMTLKCYMADTGLLISHAFDENGNVSEELYKKLLFDKLEVNKGMIVENVVAQMLVASGHKLYFYSCSCREDKEERMEIDFLIAKSKTSNRHNISPIEVKSSKNYTITSLKKFIRKFDQQTNTPYVLHTGDLKEENGIVFLPLYMTPLF